MLDERQGATKVEALALDGRGVEQRSLARGEQVETRSVEFLRKENEAAYGRPD